MNLDDLWVKVNTSHRDQGNPDVNNKVNKVHDMHSQRGQLRKMHAFDSTGVAVYCYIEPKLSIRLPCQCQLYSLPFEPGL
jgi:hypothetical protein